MSRFKQYMTIIQEAEITSDIHMAETEKSKLQNEFIKKAKDYYSNKKDDDKDKDSLIKNIAKNLFFLKQFKNFEEFKAQVEASLRDISNVLPRSAEKTFRSFLQMKGEQMIMSNRPGMENTYISFNDREKINNANDFGNAENVLKKNNSK